MKESSDWVENIHLGQFEYEEFKNELTKKKYWRLPDKLFIKLSNTRKTSHIQLGQDISGALEGVCEVTVSQCEVIVKMWGQKKNLKNMRGH